MFVVHVEHYLTLGQNISILQRMLESDDARVMGAVTRHGVTRPFTISDSTAAVVGQLRSACLQLGLATSVTTIDSTMQNFSHPSQIEVLLHLVKNEMSGRLYLHIPPARAEYYNKNDIISSSAKNKFGLAWEEMLSSGNSYACGLWNASVFHAMRAVEEALLIITDELGIAKSGAEQWGNLIEKIESKLLEITKLPKSSMEKSTYLRPLSEIVIDIRLFKDAWRNQNSHNVIMYADGHALMIIGAVRRVLEAVAAQDWKVKERFSPA